MRKLLAITLIIILAAAPAIVFSQDALSLLETYAQADMKLSGLIENHASLVESREDSLEKYENMRIRQRDLFSYVQALVSRDTGIYQVDRDIENARNAILKRKSELEIDFRNSYYNLYSLKKSMDAAKTAADEASKAYQDALRSEELGYTSASGLANLEYSSMSANHAFLRKQRAYESSLRKFNLAMGYSLDYEGYSFDFSEDMADVMDLQHYTDAAADFSPSLVSIRQQLEKYGIQKGHYDNHNLSTLKSHVREAVWELGVNIRLQELLLAKAEDSVKASIQARYNSLVIQKEYLGLSELNIKVKKEAYDTNSSLYARGYIEYAEYEKSKDAWLAAKEDHILMVYSYNTQVKELELESALYLSEDSEQ